LRWKTGAQCEQQKTAPAPIFVSAAVTVASSTEARITEWARP
jgi:hypothetical protein